MVEKWKSTKVKDGPIDAVIFDIGNVLVDYMEIRFYENKGYSKEMALRMANASMRDKDWGEVDRGVLSHQEYVNLFVENDPGIEKQLREALADMSTLVSKRETAKPWIRKCKQHGLKVLVLSNFSKEAHEQCKDALSFLDEIDGGILSYQYKVIKPEMVIYDLLCEKEHLDPSRCVFIDDSLANLIAASQKGIQTIWYQKQAQAEAELDHLMEL